MEALRNLGVAEIIIVLKFEINSLSFGNVNKIRLLNVRQTTFKVHNIMCINYLLLLQ